MTDWFADAGEATISFYDAGCKQEKERVVDIIS